ncbi:hypothetical protein V5N11_034654 [Cardamine amara subsp. amara]|uniref:Replication protein A 70 kDa DNA-binding subunit B/D first OB fold domain-containing protein n=1 Tax=Cardamine amara subsp. amara TaxID=228776 RepID=A0ABD1AXH1_CARAN
MATDRHPYSMLGDLQKDLTNQAIIVRLIRKWEACNRRRGSKLMSLDLLLMDETGFVIKAPINHRLARYYNNIFQEVSIYYISNFALDENNGRLKLTDHKLSIQFTHLTIASEVLDDAPRIGKPTFRFHSHEQLLMLANTNQIYIRMIRP